MRSKCMPTAHGTASRALTESARADAIAFARREARAQIERFERGSAQFFSVEALAAELDVQIVEAPLLGASAQLVVGLGHVCIYVSSRMVDQAARQHAIAHELGHFVLNHPAPPVEELLRPEGRRFSSTSVREEVEAEAFAVELLRAGIGLLDEGARRQSW